MKCLRVNRYPAEQMPGRGEVQSIQLETAACIPRAGGKSLGCLANSTKRIFLPFNPTRFEIKGESGLQEDGWGMDLLRLTTDRRVSNSPRLKRTYLLSCFKHVLFYHCNWNIDSCAEGIWRFCTGYWNFISNVFHWVATKPEYGSPYLQMMPGQRWQTHLVLSYRWGGCSFLWTGNAKRGGRNNPESYTVIN